MLMRHYIRGTWILMRWPVGLAANTRPWWQSVIPRQGRHPQPPSPQMVTVADDTHPSVLGMAVHIQDPVISVRVLRLSHNNCFQYSWSGLLLLLTQWWIRNFFEGCASFQKCYYYSNFFVENCMKMKEFGLRGPCVPGSGNGSYSSHKLPGDE